MSEIKNISKLKVITQIFLLFFLYGNFTIASDNSSIEEAMKKIKTLKVCRLKEGRGLILLNYASENKVEKDEGGEIEKDYILDMGMKKSKGFYVSITWKDGKGPIKKDIGKLHSHCRVVPDLMKKADFTKEFGLKISLAELFVLIQEFIRKKEAEGHGVKW